MAPFSPLPDCRCSAREILSLALLLSCHAHAASISSWGHPSCPCLGISEVVNDTVSGSSVEHLTPQDRWRYGVGCGKHDDHNLSSKCKKNAERPEYCGDAWCYTGAPGDNPGDDPSNKLCSWSTMPSTTRPGRHYSYATCGYVDKYSQREVLRKSWAGREMRIANLHNTGGWKGSYCENDEDGQSCSGPVQYFLTKVIEASGAKKKRVTTFVGGPIKKYPQAFPDEVMHQFYRDNPNGTSTFTACAFATGMGAVDVCLGASASVLKRRELTYMIPLYTEPVYLFSTKVIPSPTFWDYMLIAFRPFKLELWLVMFTYIAVASLALAWQERDNFKVGPRRTSAMDIAKESVSSFIHFTGEISRSFTGMGSDVTVTRTSSRATTFGVSVFFLFFFCSYTASLTTFMVVENDPTAAISSWKEVMANPEHRVCFLRTLERRVKVNLGLSKEQMVKELSRTAVLEGVGSKCAAAIVPLEDFQNAQRHGSFCHLMRVGDPLFHITWAASVSTRVARVLEVFKAEAVDMGEWKAAIDMHLFEGECTDTLKKDGTDGLPVSTMLGPLSLATSLLCVGVLIRFYEIAQAQRAKMRPLRRRASARRDSVLSMTSSQEDVESLEVESTSSKEDRDYQVKPRELWTAGSTPPPKLLGTEARVDVSKMDRVLPLV